MVIGRHRHLASDDSAMANGQTVGLGDHASKAVPPHDLLLSGSYLVLVATANLYLNKDNLSGQFSHGRNACGRFCG